MIRLGIAADHGGFELKELVKEHLRDLNYIVKDFGAFEKDPFDDYPDFVIPMARSVSSGEVDRGIAICGSGVGASVAASKIAGVRACLMTDAFSAHQGVEDDNMNVITLGGRVTGYALAWDLIHIFLSAEFKGEEKYKRRLNKIAELEHKEAIQ